MNTYVGVTASVVTMSSREVGDLTGKRHSDVKRDIEVMVAQLSEDVSKFAHTYLDSMNRTQIEYLLDREHVECLLAGYSAVIRMKVIRRLRELEDKNQIPQTLPEALRLAADLAEEKLQLENQLSIAAPKVEFVDRYVQATGSMVFRNVCKLLKAKETDFRLFLIENRIMYRLAGGLTPYQQHIDLERFEVKTGTNTINNHAFTQARFTPKGVKWIGGLWTEYLAKKGHAA
ncbi:MULTISPECIES: phage antirepressor KilAC domain-containing protein [Yersinia]|uniref:phage antirepressor KilAC domain-containing protein n=1 Tax=Yersinia TaxID=629 RepID=UPI0005E18820|nr:phage antirepressor KilAC domain-containing protein [Yersinia intermedia]EKN3596684.1 phage antirepressor KilAC domain-containing protein [Yersinia enterocolitica]EKN4899534.1 phage antirepressor KilAC domain-containing protein [Yersinia enterocolitica]ELW7390527.1 phage antirepressor KilAC domain-containing protein [Yersinia enterocolitica]CNI90240.1 phage regulatory protein [Yersinia intermedia]